MHSGSVGGVGVSDADWCDGLGVDVVGVAAGGVDRGAGLGGAGLGGVGLGVDIECISDSGK